MNTYQEIDAHARAIRRDHGGRTSRGLAVEIARYCVDNPLPGDDFTELLADLQQCAAECIGAGCEPRVRPLPGQDSLGARLAAPDQVNQVEGTTALTPSPARRRPLPGQSAGVACLAAVAQVNQVEGTTLPRLLRSPVGAWVHLHKRPYFNAYYLTCGVVTRQGVLTSERRA